MTDLLFSTSRIAPIPPQRRSVVVVGLPRSGSSLLSQLMSELPEWYVFDDFYLARAAKQAGVFEGTLTSDVLPGLLDFLGWQIRARLRHGQFAIPSVTEDEVQPMNDALAEAFNGQKATWTDLQEEWLIRLAARAGATHWGYKMPGAFRHLDLLLDTYPAMKAVFLMREPEAVLASYKHMPKTSEDGDPAQYHPLTHAVYWRMAARAYRQAHKKHGQARVMLVRFENMIATPEQVLTDLAAFLETPMAETINLPPRGNTSFPGARKALPGMEQRLVSAITGPMRRDLGFSAPDRIGLRPGDVLDVCTTTVRAGLYRAKQLARKT